MNNTINTLCRILACLTIVGASKASDDVGISTDSADVWNVEIGVNCGPNVGVMIGKEKSPSGGMAVDFQYHLQGVPGELTYGEYRRKDVVRIDGMPTRLSAWVNGDGQQLPWAVRFRDADGTWLQWSLGRIDWAGWKEVNYDLSKDAPGFSSWKDGEEIDKTIPITLPINFQGFSFDKRVDGDNCEGTISIADLKIQIE